MNPYEFEQAKRRIQKHEERCRKSVLNNLTTLLSRTRHRFTVEEWTEIDFQLKRAGIKIL